jgi:hypothetical protein
VNAAIPLRLLMLWKTSRKVGASLGVWYVPAVGFTPSSVDGQTLVKPYEVKEPPPLVKTNEVNMPPPIINDGDDTGWKIVMAKGRRSYADVMKREKATMVTFSCKLKL